MREISDVIWRIFTGHDLNQYERTFLNNVFQDRLWIFEYKHKKFQIVAIDIPQVNDDSNIEAVYVITPMKKFFGRKRLLVELENIMTENGFYVATNPNVIPYDTLLPHIDNVFEEFYSEIQ